MPVKILEPLLATQLKPEQRGRINLPVLASLKMDGIRALFMPVEPYLFARKGEPIRNSWLAKNYFHEIISFVRDNNVVLDGEIWSPDISFQQIMSYTQTLSKEVDPTHNLAFHCFDALWADEWNGDEVAPYCQRYMRLKGVTGANYAPVEHKLLTTWEDIDAWFEQVIASGGEGLMLRRPDGGYKHGRSTVREGILLKLKQFETEDAIVVGYEPYTTLSSDAIREYDAFGRPKGVNRQSDRVVQEALGALIVRDANNREFRIGSGFDFRGGEKDRKRLWDVRDTLIGRTVEFKHMACGAKDKPRFPIFLRFREAKQ